MDTVAPPGLRVWCIDESFPGFRCAPPRAKARRRSAAQDFAPPRAKARRRSAAQWVKRVFERRPTGPARALCGFGGSAPAKPGLTHPTRIFIFFDPRAVPGRYYFADRS
jgi:hypothetical protein